jgi:ATP-dependent DNA ligase
LHKPTETLTQRELFPSHEVMQPTVAVASASDVLWVDGERVTRRPLRDRKAILADIALDGPAWREAPWQVGGGRALLAACEELGLEGIVAKRLDSIYRGARAGSRSVGDAIALTADAQPTRIVL